MILGLLSFVACKKYDEIAMWNKSEDASVNVTYLQLITEALQNNDYVTAISPITENGEIIGYRIVFAKSDPVTIYNNENGGSMFSDIDCSDPDYFILTLAENGEQIKLPYYKDKFDLLFVSENDMGKEMTIYCEAGTTTEVRYELTNPMNVPIAVECVSHSGYKVVADKKIKKIFISAPDDPTAIGDSQNEILIFASEIGRAHV